MSNVTSLWAHAEEFYVGRDCITGRKKYEDLIKIPNELRVSCFYSNYNLAMQIGAILSVKDENNEIEDLVNDTGFKDLKKYWNAVVRNTVFSKFQFTKYTYCIDCVKQYIKKIDRSLGVFSDYKKMLSYNLVSKQQHKDLLISTQKTISEALTELTSTFIVDVKDDVGDAEINQESFVFLAAPHKSYCEILLRI